jgi:transcriptional regulator with XRE-family HTH domain
MSEEEIEAEKRRRGYWLRLARSHAGEKGGVMNQAVAANALGLSENSGSTISNWEHGRGEGPSAQQLLQLARLYKVPASWFFEPRPTDEEALLALSAGAAAAALEDEEGPEEAPDPEVDEPPDESPGRP